MDQRPNQDLPLSRRGSPHQPPEVRRAQILQAAAQCIAEHGFARMTMDRVAETAGLSKGSLYRFFQSKDDLLPALLEDSERLRLEKIPKDPPDHALDHLKAYCLPTVEVMTQYGEWGSTLWAEYLIHTHSREQLNRVQWAIGDDLARIIRAGVESGEVREGVEPNDTADTILALMAGLFMLSGTLPGFEVVDRFNASWSLIENGLRP